MKTKLHLIALATPLLFSFSVISSGQNIKYTTLPAAGKNMPVKSFTAIKASGIFNLILEQGSTESVVVKGDYPADLKVTNDGNTILIMDTLANASNNGNHKTDIYITFKHLDAMETELVGETKTLNPIKTSEFTYESNGVGGSTLLLDAGSAKISQKGVGALSITGKANTATIEDKGAGSLEADDFKVGVLHVSINGVGNAKVYAGNEIYLNVTSVGGVTYYGPAKVMENTDSGVGKVSHGE